LNVASSMLPFGTANFTVGMIELSKPIIGIYIYRKRL
jgi:hypothetical protein